MSNPAGGRDAPRIYLIDGSSYIFRAYFGMPRLTNSSGLATHAIYGFTTMTLKLLKDQRPQWLVMVFDTGGETFRDQIYRDYKANRPEAPDDLVPQFPYIRQVLQAMNIAVLEHEGFEADDLIATLAKHFSSSDTEVVIVSGDKDLMQLVGGSVRMLDTMKAKWIGVEEVRQKFGVDPSKVVEVMALMGDAVDNIRGVKGIGEKTAIALIQQFHTLENLYDHLDDLDQVKIRGRARVRKALIEGRDDAMLSRELATVRTDVPVPLELDHFRYREPSMDKLRELYSQLEFTHLLRELDSQGFET
jgi:DNA polymerase-1